MNLSAAWRRMTWVTDKAARKAAQWTAIGVALLVALLLAIALIGGLVTYVSQSDRQTNAENTAAYNGQLVQAYCTGPTISAAETQGCETHVSAARVEALEAEGDQTALNADRTAGDAMNTDGN
jgi:hypothetical protein